MCTVCTGPMRDPSDLYFIENISLGCEHLCTDGRLYTILHRKEAVYIVHSMYSVYRPYERPLSFRLKILHKFRLWTFVYRWETVHDFAQKGSCVHCAQCVQAL